MGREPKMNALAIAQYGDARTMGGGAALQKLRLPGSRTGEPQCLADVLAPGRLSRIHALIHPRRGRYHVVVDGTLAVETQGLLWTDEAARSFAWGCFAEGLASPVSQLGREDFYRWRWDGPAPDARTVGAGGR